MSLQNFKLDDLMPYTREGVANPRASADFRLFFVGRDDVHGALTHVLSQCTVSLYLGMFGYDDDELNEIIMDIIHDPTITCLITLDKSQAAGVHEKRLLDSDAAKDPIAFNTHFVIGQSATHQISHTKGFVVDGIVGAEGSTNWSASGEGIKVPGKPYRAQNNTQSFFTCPDSVARFQAQLIAEHAAAQHGAIK